jgi:hypothetical protein
MLSFPEFVQVRKEETQGVHLGVDLLVLSELWKKLHRGSIRFMSLFPDVVRRYYRQCYRGRGTKTIKNPKAKLKKEEKMDPCDSPTGGVLTLQILVYHSMANFSDLNGNTNLELKPLWNLIGGNDLVERAKWEAAIHDYGSFLLGYQNMEVSGMAGEEYSIDRI